MRWHVVGIERRGAAERTAQVASLRRCGRRWRPIETDCPERVFVLAYARQRASDGRRAVRACLWRAEARVACVARMGTRQESRPADFSGAR